MFQPPRIRVPGSGTDAAPAPAPRSLVDPAQLTGKPAATAATNASGKHDVSTPSSWDSQPWADKENASDSCESDSVDDSPESPPAGVAPAGRGLQGNGMGRLTPAAAPPGGANLAGIRGKTPPMLPPPARPSLPPALPPVLPPPLPSTSQRQVSFGGAGAASTPGAKEAIKPSAALGGSDLALPAPRQAMSDERLRQTFSKPRNSPASSPVARPAPAHPPSTGTFAGAGSFTAVPAASTRTTGPVTPEALGLKPVAGTLQGFISSVTTTEPVPAPAPAPGAVPPATTKPSPSLGVVPAVDASPDVVKSLSGVTELGLEQSPVVAAAAAQAAARQAEDPLPPLTTIPPTPVNMMGVDFPDTTQATYRAVAQQEPTAPAPLGRYPPPPADRHRGGPPPQPSPCCQDCYVVDRNGRRRCKCEVKEEDGGGDCCAKPAGAGADGGPPASGLAAVWASFTGLFQQRR